MQNIDYDMGNVDDQFVQNTNGSRFEECVPHFSAQKHFRVDSSLILHSNDLKRRYHGTETDEMELKLLLKSWNLSDLYDYFIST